MFENIVVEISGDLDKLQDRLKAIDEFAKKHPQLNIYLFAPEKYDLAYFLPRKNIKLEKSKSIRNSLMLLSEIENVVYLSAGDTGRITRNAVIVVGLVFSNIVPILVNTFPKSKKDDFMIYADMGGGSLWPNQKYLFPWAAYAGEAIANSLYGKAIIGLQNIGEENGKGGLEIEKVRKMLEFTFKDKFIGNIEFNKAIDSDVNVLLTSGFLGNFHLKSYEGTVKLLINKILGFSSNPIIKFFMKLQLLKFKIFLKELDWKEYSGSYLIGMKKPILITHGRCDQKAFYNALKRAIAPETEIIYNSINNSRVIKYALENQNNPQT